VKIDYSVKGVDLVHQRLEGVSDRAADARPAMRLVRDLMQDSNKKQFASGGSHLGTPWAPDAPSTLARKAGKGQDIRPNRATGALEASLTGGKGKRSSATKTSARAGTSLFYGRFAQTGTKRAPKRAIVGLGEADQRKAREIVLRYITHGLV